MDRPSGFCDSQLTKTPRAKHYFYNTSCIFPNISVHFSCKSYLLHRGVYLPKKLYILVVSSIFLTISDIFFSISCIFSKISCM